MLSNINSEGIDSLMYKRENLKGIETLNFTNLNYTIAICYTNGHKIYKNWISKYKGAVGLPPLMAA